MNDNLIKTKLVPIVVTCIASHLLLSCDTIREGRDSCPTYLTLEFAPSANKIIEQTKHGIDNIWIILEYPNGQLFEEKINSNIFNNVTEHNNVIEHSIKHEIKIPRGKAKLAVYGNISGMYYDYNHDHNSHSGLIAPSGSPIDSLYTFFTEGEYTDDICTQIVTLNKDYIDIWIKVMGITPHSSGETSDETSPLIVEISGECIGYSNMGGIIHGSFIHSPIAGHSPNDSASYYLFNTRVSRQDRELLLSLKKGENERIVDFSLIEKMNEAGISMSDSDLENLFITIDYSQGTSILKIDNFSIIDHYEIEF